MGKKVLNLEVITIGKPDLKNMPKVDFDVFIATLEREISIYYQTKKDDL
jgi:hypothetical protein